eukprot:3579528-Rhodomonas_salina.1
MAMPPTASAAAETSVSAGPASIEAGSSSSSAAGAAGLEELQSRMGLLGFWSEGWRTSQREILSLN